MNVGSHIDSSYRNSLWKAAIGLQDVDGLKPSPFLYEIARANIEGKIDTQTAEKMVLRYHESENDPDTREADLVSLRIVCFLDDDSFSFSPDELLRIHERLFSGIYDHAGKYRSYNITKKEWVLNGDTVLYSPHEIIAATLYYAFREERGFSYDISSNDVSRHLASFVSDVWQIHPFAEGNTRTVAVFLIRYLKYLGFELDYEPFEISSWYFRNALVMANCSNIRKGIFRTNRYLELFLDNLLFGTGHELKNRYMHVDYRSDEVGHP